MAELVCDTPGCDISLGVCVRQSRQSPSNCLFRHPRLNHFHFLTIALNYILFCFVLWPRGESPSDWEQSLC